MQGVGSHTWLSVAIWHSADSGSASGGWVGWSSPVNHSWPWIWSELMGGGCHAGTVQKAQSCVHIAISAPRNSALLAQCKQMASAVKYMPWAWPWWPAVILAVKAEEQPLLLYPDQGHFSYSAEGHTGLPLVKDKDFHNLLSSGLVTCQDPAKLSPPSFDFLKLLSWSQMLKASCTGVSRRCQWQGLSCRNSRYHSLPLLPTQRPSFGLMKTLGFRRTSSKMLVQE